MPVAIFGASGRSDAAIATLMLARGLDEPVRLIRVTLPEEPLLNEGHAYDPSTIVIEQLSAGDVSVAASLAVEALRGHRDRRLVLDLPLPLAWHADVRARLGLAVLACGSMPLDETAALAAHVRAAEVFGTSEGETRPAWVLGCARAGGGPAARVLAQEMEAASGKAGVVTPRCLPFVLPPLGHFQAYWLENGIPDDRTIAVARAFAQALDQVRSAPWADAFAIDQVPLLAADARTPEERLRAVADDLDGLRCGSFPDAATLRAAPVIEQWSYEVRPRKVVVGTVGPGHPTVRAGRKIVTSELFASDGKTWARTLGRTFRLGAKA